MEMNSYGPQYLGECNLNKKQSVFDQVGGLA